MQEILQLLYDKETIIHVYFEAARKRVNIEHNTVLNNLMLECFGEGLKF